MSATGRQFLGAASTITVAPPFLRGQSPALVTADSARPVITHGVMSGDVAQGSAVVWSRTNRPARMIVEYSTSE
jgi:alkaline phosphatase D